MFCGVVKPSRWYYYSTYGVQHLKELMKRHGYNWSFQRAGVALLCYNSEESKYLLVCICTHCGPCYTVFPEMLVTAVESHVKAEGYWS